MSETPSHLSRNNEKIPMPSSRSSERTWQVSLNALAPWERFVERVTGWTRMGVAVSRQAGPGRAGGWTYCRYWDRKVSR
jgi:hypothetical protein